jgi:hypothetical protein
LKKINKNTHLIMDYRASRKENEELFVDKDTG